MENKKEIVIWLKNNIEKSDDEIRKFLLLQINDSAFKESWNKYYFLEDLKSSTNGLSKNVQKIIKEVQKEIDNKPGVGRSVLAHFAFGVVGISVWIISAQIIGFVLLAITVLFTKNTDILNLVTTASQLIGMVLGIWGGSRASRWVKNYKKDIKKNITN